MTSKVAYLIILQEYGMTRQEKLTIAQGICAPLLRKIRADLQRNICVEDEDDEEQTCYRLDPRYSSGVCSPGRHVRTRLYFTSESHIHSLLTILSEGGLVDSNDEQWQRAMDYVSLVSELNYMTQVRQNIIIYFDLFINCQTFINNINSSHQRVQIEFTDSIISNVSSWKMNSLANGIS